MPQACRLAVNPFPLVDELSRTYALATSSVPSLADTASRSRHAFTVSPPFHRIGPTSGSESTSCAASGSNRPPRIWYEPLGGVSDHGRLQTSKRWVRAGAIDHLRLS